MMRKRKMTSGRYSRIHLSSSRLYQESNCTCRKKNHFLFRWSTPTLPERLIHPWMCWKKHIDDYWNLDGEIRIVWCMDRLHKIHLIWKPPDGTHGRSVDSQENNLSPRQCMARNVDVCVWCSEEESKTKMGCRETKARQCQTIERNILHWTWRWRIQAHNQSRSKRVGMPAAMPCKIPIKSSGETYRNIGKRKTKYACVVDADESPRPRLEGAVHKHHKIISLKKIWILWIITILITNSFLCLKLWKFLRQKQQWTRNGKNWRKSRRCSWRKSETRKRWSMARGMGSPRHVDNRRRRTREGPNLRVCKHPFISRGTV